MDRLFLAGLLAVLLFLPPNLAAQDFEGRWETARETRRGTVTWTLTLTRDGDAWSGTLDLMQRTVELKEVRVEGDRVRFTVEMETPARGGREGRTVAQTFTGTLQDDRISGEMEGPRGAIPTVWTRPPG